MLVREAQLEKHLEKTITDGQLSKSPNGIFVKPPQPLKQEEKSVTAKQESNRPDGILVRLAQL